MAEKTIETHFPELLRSIRNELHPRAYEIVEGFVKYGEERVAAEHLCELLCEDQLILPSVVYQKLVELVDSVGVEERFKEMIPRPSDSD